MKTIFLLSLAFQKLPVRASEWSVFLCSILEDWRDVFGETSLGVRSFDGEEVTVQRANRITRP